MLPRNDRWLEGRTMIFKRSVQVLLTALAGSATAHATEVAVCTDSGRAVLELADTQSPLHVENFLRYVDMGYYSGTVFHRVVRGFVVQGGGVDRKLRGRPTLPPVASESSNGLSNVRGSVAAARTQDPNSATAQFFINLEDNPALDGGDEPGYTVFARVKDGITMFDEISRLPTGAAGPFRGEVPTPLVAIKSMARLDEAALAEWPADGREAALKEQITAAGAANNHTETLRLIGHYRALCGADDPNLSVLEAQAALATDDRRRAVFVLEEFFATTDAAHPAYEAATAVYRQAMPENQQSAAQLVDDCEPPEAPVLPDGGTATMDEMIGGQTRVREFVAGGETYLACLTKIIDDTERSAADRNAAIAEHNRTVAAMEQAAAGFNEQIRKFKARG
jgi:cyclophilin family peptidyl-prolyl cis-trans isomerase